MRWYYISFAGDDGWLGCCVVFAGSPDGAIRQAWIQGLNPGGEALVVEISPDDEKASEPLKNRLITDKAELERLIGPLTRIGTCARSNRH